ncbi:MAG TPA: ATP-binding protein [Pyrinomonadaceae bacterium]|nr:ATP-binding protein [Pyrinomonadaceae bacterium]
MTRETSVKGAASAARRYGVAVLSVAVALALTRALWPWVDPHPTPLFLAAVMLSALYAGLGPSLVATALAALVVDYFFIPPTSGIELSVDNAVRTGIFVAVALLVSWIDAARRRAEAELRRHATQQAAVAELGQRALWGTNLAGLTDKAVSVLARRLDAESAALWEYQPESDSLKVRSSVGWTAAFIEEATADAGSESMLSRALFSTEPVVVGPETAPHFGEPPHLRREASGSVSVAVAGRGEPFGVLSVYTDSPRGFTEEDVHFVQSVANVLSAAVERARGEEERSRLLRGEREARREAEQANRAKDEFLAMVSHELRTPLGVITGWARLLRDGGVDEQTTGRALEMIERNALLQKRLIEDLIDVSRIMAGKLRVESRLTELPPVIEDAVAAVALSAKTKGIRVDVECGRDSGVVLGDPERLQQVVWNLLSNAIKFTPEGGRVEVRVERVGASAQITVGDTGHGIGSDLLPYVFEPFRQGADAGAGRRGGLGLGLSIVRHLVEAHGGTVEAESPGEGRGATFRVRLPLAPADSRVPPVRDGEVICIIDGGGRAPAAGAAHFTEAGAEDLRRPRRALSSDGLEGRGTYE